MLSKSILRSLGSRIADRVPVLVDLYRMGLNPGWEITNWRDYYATYRKIGWIRELPAPTADAPRVLLVMRRENLFDIKYKLMLGSALKLKGVEPIVLASHRRVPRILRYSRAFGVAKLCFRDQYHPRSTERDETIALVSQLMGRPHDFASVRDWTYRGYPLGERVLSTLIRETLTGEPDLAEPGVLATMKRILSEVLANYREAEEVLNETRPTWVLSDETGYGTNGPLVDVALSRGMDVFEVTPFLREGTLLFKRMNRELGRNPAASVSRATLEALAASPWTSELDAELMGELEGRYESRSELQRMYQWNTESVDRAEICRELELDPTLPIAVVFSHVLWDASFFYGQDLFLNYRDWLEKTLCAAVDNPRVNWLIKTHPANAFRLMHGDIAGPVAEVQVVRQSVVELPAHVRLLLPETRISSLSLYRHADLGVTVRSTAGLEMACFGKSVLTAGTGHYTGLGFTVDSATREEYLDRLRRIERLGPTSRTATVTARQYAFALFRLRPWIARSFELRLDFPERGWHPLDRNVVPRARSLEEAERHGDLHRWAEWAVNDRAADYLEEPSAARSSTGAESDR